MDSQKFGGSFFEKARLFLDLKPELFKRWREGQGQGRGIKIAEGRQTGRLEIAGPDAFIQNITLNPKETFSVDLHFELPKDYRLRRGAFAEFDLVQVGAPGKPEAIVGGQRFVLDLTKLVLVKSSDQWRYRDDGSYPGQAWTSAGFDDSKWKLGKAEFGFGGNQVTTIDGAAEYGRPVTRYFRHTFDVADPSFYRNLLLRLKRSDGAVVYLNGKEVHRVNLPAGAVDARRLATREVTGLEKEVFFPVKIDPGNLTREKNVMAVEIHQNSLRSDRMTFDLELSPNRADTGFAPDLAFAGPPDGALFQEHETVPVELEALATDGKIRSVSLYVDGKLAGSAEQPPYRFTWTAGAKGLHRLRAEAVDTSQSRTTSLRSVTVVEVVPPVVSLIQPSEGTEAKAKGTISISARASDRNTKVKRVEFWVREADFFMSKSRLVSTASTAPYRAQIKDLKPGQYMVWAVAVNDRGASSQSMPVHVKIK